MNGLSFVNIELTSRCNKGDGTPGSGCFMCGRRKIEKEYPDLADWGDMPFGMLEMIAEQLPPGIVVQLHNNGEPTLYPRLRDALRLFDRQITGFDTNGQLLMARYNEIVGEIDTLTVSVIPNDPSQVEQMLILDEFLAKKGRAKRPLMVLRLLGDVPEGAIPPRAASECILVRRVLHSPDGSRDYAKPVTIPEMGICLEVLTKLSIDRKGQVSPCVRFDPHGLGIIGNLTDAMLFKIWHGLKRAVLLELHTTGQRNRAALCSTCDYWGVPTN